MTTETTLPITVQPMNKARRTKRRYDAVVTIEDPGQRNGLRFHRVPHPDHLVLKFEDIDVVDDEFALPMSAHVEAVLAFGREHASSRLLIHCKVGIARSTAMALAVMADRLGPGHEAEAVSQLLDVRPQAIPNLIILDMADRLLGRDGALTSAWMKVENSSREYASHRSDKLALFRKRPELFAKSFSSARGTILRFRPGAITPAYPALVEITEPEVRQVR